MKLRLEREASANGATIGQLFVDGAEFCYTLEDVVREKWGVPVKGWKIAGETAIPRGDYNVVITHSNRFNRQLPLLENVEGFEGVRIHPGNTAADTEGCILVGRSRTDRTVTESRAAFNELFAKLADAIEHGDTASIEIV